MNREGNRDRIVGCELRGMGFVLSLRVVVTPELSACTFLAWGKFLNVFIVSGTLGQWKECKVGG